MKRLKRMAIAVTVAVSMSTSALAAVQYIDIPQNHWAYESVQEMAEKGLMVGNSKREFLPNHTVDYFTFSQIMAKIAGYRDPLIVSGVSEEQKRFAQRAYTAYKPLLDRYDAKFKNWDKTSNEEVSYLLQKGIFKELDLAKFVVSLSGGGEAVLSLRKEDLVVYVVRSLGKEQEALEQYSTVGFADEKEIREEAKPYVAYMKKIGLIRGDAQNKFHPKDKVTRAVLAKVLSDMFTYEKPQSSDNTNSHSSDSKKPATQPNTPSSSTDQEIYVQGKVEKFYESLYYILISYGEGKQSYYYIDKNAPIYIKDKQTNMSSIKPGYDVLVKISKQNGQEKITKVIIVDTTSKPSTKPPVKDSIKDKPSQPSTPSYSNISTKEIHGIVDEVYKNGQIDIRVKYLDYKGSVQEEVQRYQLKSGARLVKEDKNIDFDDLDEGDIIIADINGNYLYDATVMDKQREIKGVLLQRKREESMNYIVIKNEKGQMEEYKLPADAKMEKKRKKDVSYNDLRIGDELKIKVDYDEIVSLYAEGYEEETEGVIREIVISAFEPKITLQLEDGTLHTYYVIPNAKYIRDKDDRMIDIYQLRLGQQVEMELDSQEAEKITLENQGEIVTLQGYIEDVGRRGDYIELKGKENKRIYLDAETDVFEGTRKLSKRDLDEDMFVVITLDSYGSNRAQKVHILAEE